MVEAGPAKPLKTTAVVEKERCYSPPPWRLRVSPEQVSIVPRRRPLLLMPAVMLALAVTVGVGLTMLPVGVPLAWYFLAPAILVVTGIIMLGVDYARVWPEQQRGPWLHVCRQTGHISVPRIDRHMTDTSRCHLEIQMRGKGWGFYAGRHASPPMKRGVLVLLIDADEQVECIELIGEIGNFYLRRLAKRLSAETGIPYQGKR